MSQEIGVDMLTSFIQLLHYNTVYSIYAVNISKSIIILLPSVVYM